MPDVDKPDPRELAADGDDVIEGVDPPTAAELARARGQVTKNDIDELAAKISAATGVESEDVHSARVEFEGGP